MTFLSTLFAALAFFSMTAAHADQSVGEIQEVKGDIVAASFYGAKRQLEVRDLVYQGDILSTSNGSEALILFKDGSNFLVGSDSEIVIDEMIYDQYTKDGRFISRLIRGALLVVSGQLNNKDKDVMKIKTSLATIGIRGTKLFLKVDSKKEQFVLLQPEKNEGPTSIHVSSKWGATLVDKINHGTIVQNGKAPTDQQLVNLGTIDKNFSILEKPSKRKFAVAPTQEAGFFESVWRLVEDRLK
jgi:hypothetical protein